MNSAARLLIAFMLLTVRDVWPCSLEILSIDRLASDAPNVVVGTVDSVVGEIVEGWVEPDAEFQLRALQSAEFRIEDNLKGEIAADRIELSFDPELVRSSCAFLLFGFEPGHRLILMLGSPDENGRYPAPLVWPRRLGLGRAEEEHRDFPLYQYVAGLRASGLSPTRVEFDVPEVVAANSALDMELKIENDLEGALTVRLVPDHPTLGAAEGAVLWIQAVGAWPEAFVVEPSSSRTIRLAEYFTTTKIGRQHVEGISGPAQFIGRILQGPPVRAWQKSLCIDGRGSDERGARQ